MARHRRALAIVGLSAAAVAGVAVLYLAPGVLSNPVHTHSSPSPPTITAPGEQVAFTFLTPSLGWAAATIEPHEHSLYVFATDDGARSWRQIAILNVQEASTPFIFRFFDATRGVLVAGNEGVVFRTRDGGKSWSKVVLPGNAWSPGFATFTDWTTSDLTGTVYSTTDGGASWVRLPDLPAQGAIVFETADEGWLGGPGHLVYRTTDRGQTWRAVHLPPPACAPSGSQCAFAGGGGGVGLTLLGDGGLLAEDFDYAPEARFISDDGGATWRYVPVPPGTTDYTGISYQDSSHWWLVDDDRLLKSSDAGASWTLISSSLPFAISPPMIIDAEHAWVTFGLDDAPALMTTSDGGLNWKYATVPIPH